MDVIHVEVRYRRHPSVYSRMLSEIPALICEYFLLRIIRLPVSEPEYMALRMYLIVEIPISVLRSIKLRPPISIGP